MLSQFPYSVVLAEKPSHNSSEKALEFKRQLQQKGIDKRRFLVGMHTALHPLST